MSKTRPNFMSFRRKKLSHYEDSHLYSKNDKESYVHYVTK